MPKCYAAKSRIGAEIIPELSADNSGVLNEAGFGVTSAVPTKAEDPCTTALAPLDSANPDGAKASTEKLLPCAVSSPVLAEPIVLPGTGS